MANPRVLTGGITFIKIFVIKFNKVNRMTDYQFWKIYGLFGLYILTERT